MYSQGLGVERNYARAAGWYRRAAAQNQIDALHSLGWMHLNGYGVTRDPVRAYVLCGIALAQGEAKGLPCRESAERQMTDGQLRKAESELSRWNELADGDRLIN